MDNLQFHSNSKISNCVYLVASRRSREARFNSIQCGLGEDLAIICMNSSKDTPPST